MMSYNQLVEDDEELQTLLEDLIEDERAKQTIAQSIESNQGTGNLDDN
eukprot:gene17115-19598_t